MFNGFNSEFFSKQFDELNNTFDREFKLLDDLTQVGIKLYNDTFPPYNVVKVNDDKFIIELSVPGFDGSSIEITTDDDNLTIVGKASPDFYQDLIVGELVEEGFRLTENFETSFKLVHGLKVGSSKLVNGLLRVWLERVIPKKVVRKVELNSQEPQLLNE